METVKLKIRIPRIYPCNTEGCTELTKGTFCKNCYDELLKSPVKKYEKQPFISPPLADYNLETAGLRKRFVGIER